MIPVTVDLETFPIAQRPDYPPRPVGCAFHFPGLEPFYLSWGHPTGNNATEADAKEWLHKAWASTHPILCHNAKFDLTVATERLGLPVLPWHRVHDTMFLAYLMDPHARSLGLKDLAADLLAQPATERDALNGWIWENRATLQDQYLDKVPGLTKRISKTSMGAWIFAVPGDLVGQYAVGDVTRTRDLYEHLMPQIAALGMAEAYDRERQLLPMLMENERAGMRVDMPALEQDVATYTAVFQWVEDTLRQRLNASGLNFDADQDVASVLAERGIVAEGDFVRTAPSKTHPNGQRSVSKDNLRPEVFSDPAVASMLGYRNRLKTCLSMFLEPWLAQAKIYGGRITTNWNQTRGAEYGGSRTGRPSTDKHNFLNISKTFIGRDDGYAPPNDFGIILPPLPLCRSYVLPDEGHTFLHRDFSGQELRVFAHFEQGDLYQKYLADPATDPHKFVGDELMRVAGREINRSAVKTLNFQGMYGGGIPALQAKLRCSTVEARELKAFHNQALPGRLILNDEIKKVIRRGGKIRTWGGRLYDVERPGPDGRSKEYKLINYLIQGSAADLTKQAMIDWYEHPDRDANFLVAVYDEINLSVTTEHAAAQMALLKEVMERPRLTVPMLSDGKMGPSWGRLEK